MALITAVVTAKAREKLPKMWGGLTSPFKLITKFKVGEGGWVNTPPVERRQPNPALTDLDIITNPGLYTVHATPTFTKVLVIGDFVFETPSTLKVTCTLAPADYNSNGTGSPEIWEIGLFDDDLDMLAYATFPKQIKTVAASLSNIIRILF